MTIQEKADMRDSVITLNELEDLYKKHNPSKHGLLRFYYELFTNKLDPRAVKKMLEVGCSSGSIGWWLSIFPNAQVYGCDINQCDLVDPRFTPITGNCNAAIIEMSMLLEGPYDLVIDDGSHFFKDILNLFTLLYPNVADNGVYVIEDVMLPVKNFPESPQGDVYGQLIPVLQLKAPEFEIFPYCPITNEVVVVVEKRRRTIVC